MTEQPTWRFVAPDGFDEFDWAMIESRGVVMGGWLAFGSRRFPVIIYDPVRIAQDAVGETAGGHFFYEGNVIVVENLTRETAEDAVAHLAAAGSFDWLLA
jgi:hypothetical protein